MAPHLECFKNNMDHQARLGFRRVPCWLRPVSGTTMLQKSHCSPSGRWTAKRTFRGICKYIINEKYDVAGLCRELPDRLQTLVDREGDRIGK